ncbi:MAG: hypothetical protein ACXADC_01945 [Candidatus Thorarchaeota archaeon]|jgi:hypothetical protein
MESLPLEECLLLKLIQKILSVSLVHILLFSSILLVQGAVHESDLVAGTFNQTQLEPPIWIENASLTPIGLDMSLKVFYTYNVTEHGSVSAVRLLLSLDNMSYVEGQLHEYDSHLTNGSDTARFWLSKSSRTPISFDLQAGNTLYVSVEMDFYREGDAVNPWTPPSSWRTASMALAVVVDYQAPFSVPDLWVQLFAILASALGILGLVYIVARRKPVLTKSKSQ